MSANPETHARTFGHGARQALAIHCTLAHAGAWRGLGAALNSDLTTTAIDLPGHGKSADWDGKTDFHHQCTQAALTHLTGRRDVIGHSFGATVALRLAVEHPELVRSLTLIEPVFFALVKRDDPDRLTAHQDQEQDYLSSFAAGDYNRAARYFNRLWGDGTTWDETPDATRQYMIDRITLVPEQSGMIFEDNAGLLVPGRLARAHMPCLLIGGEQSPDIIDAIHDGLARHMPNAIRATIAGAGHMSPITHPNEVAVLVSSLLETAQE